MYLEIYGIFVFFLGMIIGSFLNVVIYRFNTGRGLGGRSMCFTCRRTLSWHELIPIVSFINQKGKCHGCRSKISIQYPIVEAITGFVFVSIFLRTLTLSSLSMTTSFFFMTFYMYVFALLIVISVYDFHHKIIPDKLVWLFNVLALISTVFVFEGGFTVGIPSWSTLLAGPLVALPFFLLWSVSRGRGMGFGDVKLALGVGWLLSLAQAVAAVVLSFWIGALVGVILLILKGRKFGMKSQVPFGPFLCTAVFIVFIFSVRISDIIAWLQI